MTDPTAEFTLANYRTALSLGPVRTAMGNSLILGLGVASVGVLVMALLVWVIYRSRLVGRGAIEYLVMFPQVLVNVKVPRGFDWRKHSSIGKAQADAERALNGRGRVLLRPSGTEPVLRVMVEGEPREAIESAAQSIAAAVRSVAGA